MVRGYRQTWVDEDKLCAQSKVEMSSGEGWYKLSEIKMDDSREGWWLYSEEDMDQMVN